MNSVTFKYLNANYGTGSDSTHYYFHTTTTSNQGPKTKEKILNIFPNPATTSVAISLSLTKPESISLSLTNSMGQLVHTQNQQLVGEKNKIEIPVSNITSGVYFLSVKGKDWSRFEKVIVERN